MRRWKVSLEHLKLKANITIDLKPEPMLSESSLSTLKCSTTALGDMQKLTI